MHGFSFMLLWQGLVLASRTFYRYRQTQSFSTQENL